MNTKPTLILGIGPPKTGTSWLFRELSSHPDITPSRMKETNILNLCGYKKDITIKKYLQRLQQEDNPIESAHVGIAGGAFKIEEFQGYAEYMYGLTVHGNTRVCEISTEYCMLSRDQLENINSHLSKYFDIKIISWLRDPVERLMSHANMNAKNTGSDISEMLSSKRLIPFSMYDIFIPTFQSVFGHENVHVDFFEGATNQCGFDRVCDFLNVPHHGCDRTAVNIGDAGHFLSDEIINTLRVDMKSTYDWAMKEYYSLSTLWKYSANK
jgi:hypothetical protein